MRAEAIVRDRYDGAITGLTMVIGLVAIGISFYLSVKYSGQHILDQFAFRETQTALTAFWLSRDGFKLAYETPVVGAPWSIPFEFPIYQFIVSEISRIGGFNLEKVGRLVSYAFLLACLAPIALISKRLFPSSWRRPFWIFVSLFMSSPLYLYWGRSFMIESTALLFAIYFIYYSLALMQRDYRARNFVLAGVFLLLGMLQKSTTMLPDLAIIGLVLLAASKDQIGLRSKVMWQAIAAYGIAFGISYAWVKYSDLVKSKNIIGTLLTSDALSKWNFGTIDGRLSKVLWIDTIWERMFVQNIAGFAGAGLIMFGLIFANPKIRIYSFTCLAIFLTHFMVFQNLHVVHTYYQTSTGIFLIASLAIAIYGLSLRFAPLRFVIPILILALVSSNLYWFSKVYLDSERQPFGDDSSDIVVGNLIQEKTAPEKPIVVYGYDWSSEIAFFSHRKAMTVARWFPNYYDFIDNPIRYVGEIPAAVIACGNERTQELKDHVTQSFKPSEMVATAACDIYFR